MKLAPLRPWTLFATFGALLVVVIAIQQSVPGALSENIALRPVSAGGPDAPRLVSRNSAQFKASQDTAITIQVHPVSAPVTSEVPQQFTATVKGTTNKAVTWYVDGLLGGNDTVGTINATGLYTPPTNFAVGTHTVTAVSQVDNTTSGTATSYLVGYAGLYTNKNDNSRTGQNLQETVLTPQNVNVPTPSSSTKRCKHNRFM